MSAPDDERLVRRVARWGAILLAFSLLLGGYAAAGLTGQLPVDGRMALAAHITGLLGAFWLFAYAFTVPLLHLSLANKSRVAIVLIASQFANTIVGAVKAAWQVHGIAPVGESHNDVVFFVLLASVVVPTLGASIVWIVALRE